MDDLGFVVAGYTITALGLGAYVLRLLQRGRRARVRAEAVAARSADRG